MIRICLCGLGRAGVEIAKFLSEQGDVSIVSAICSPSSEKIDKDLGELIGSKAVEVKISSSMDLEEVILESRPDVVVDFSKPHATIANGMFFSRMKVKMVVGTTGFNNEQLQMLQEMAYEYGNGIVYAPNITLGVNTMMLLTNIASKILYNYDFQITEMHHNRKKDIPSGTAIKISDEIIKGLSQSKPFNKTIPINSVRVGGIIGKHEVLISGDEDQISISHESYSRRAFAVGALKAVNFINGNTGFYEMKDVLNLKAVLQDYLEENKCSF